MLKHEDQGLDVAIAQRLLNRAGQALTVDGHYGEVTAAAVEAFQKANGLAVDGIVGQSTNASLAALMPPKTLTDTDIDQAAEALGAEPAAVRAVTAVESRGAGFFDDGRPTILFERHICYRRLFLRRIDPAPWIEAQPDIVNPEPGAYIGGVAEHDRLDQAKAINAPAAFESASWGLFQIMGFHWARLGFASPAAFVAAMYESEGAQLQAFVQFIRIDKQLHQALKANRWAAFARRYNGPEYKTNRYHERLAEAYREASEATA